MEVGSTEQKIIAAARDLFTERGFAATRIRDIAEAAGTNVALLNYYFRSKENLFRIIVHTDLQVLFAMLIPLITDEKRTLREKIDVLSKQYTDLLLQREGLPLFILNEMKANRDVLPEEFKNLRTQLEPAILRELKNQNIAQSEYTDLFVNTISFILFPFIGKPMLFTMGFFRSETEFVQYVRHREKKISTWVLQAFNENQK